MIFSVMAQKNRCPKDRVYVNAFMQELRFEENEKFVDHILVCKECHAKFEMLGQLSEEMEKKIGKIQEQGLTAEEERELKVLAKKKIKELGRKKIWFFDLSPARYIAASAAILVLAAGLLVVSKISQREIYRGGERREEIRIIKPAGVIKEAPVVFSWSVYEGADDYMFQLIDENLDTIYQMRLNGNSLMLPGELVHKLKRGITYVWKVEARDEFGETLSHAFTSFEWR